MVANFLSQLLGKPSAATVAKSLGKRMGADPKKAGDRLRLAGTWNGARCKIVLDGAADEMNVTASANCRVARWEMRWSEDEDEALSYVSTHVALTERDATLLEGLPMKVRLHVTEVVEAGRGSLLLENRNFVLAVKNAGLTRKNGADQAAIRLDVLADLVKASSGAWKG